MDAVTIETHGAGIEARRVMRFGEMALTAFVGAGDDEPRASAADLAGWIGARPKKFRELVKRHEAAGNVRPNWRPTVGRQFTGNGASREYTIDEAWLDERDTLFVIAKAETPAADLITRKVIDVFVRVRRGTAPGLSADAMQSAFAAVLERAVAPALAALETRLAAMQAQVDAHAERAEAGTIGRAQAQKILVSFCEIASLRSGAQRRSRPWMRERATADNAVRRAVHLPIGRAWDSLPSGLYADALARTKELRADAQRVADERRQPELFPTRKVG